MESAAASVVLWFDQVDPTNATAEHCELCGQGCRTGKQNKTRQGVAKSYPIFNLFNLDINIGKTQYLYL